MSFFQMHDIIRILVIALTNLQVIVITNYYLGKWGIKTILLNPEDNHLAMKYLDYVPARAVLIV